ncbi:MAG: hypothetical protein ACE5G7_03545, partial [Candidatus Hydrothermarchaeaceae archaeon]
GNGEDRRMNEYIVTTILIAVILSAGFFWLINFGIAEVAYFGIGIVVLSIIVSILYTWWKTTSDKTIKGLKVETLSKSREDYGKTKDSITQAGQLVDIGDTIRELDALRDNLIKLGLYDKAFEKTGGKVGRYTLTFIEQQTRKTEQRLRSLETLTAGSYKPVLRDHLQSLLKHLLELEAAGFRIHSSVREFEGLGVRPAKSLVEMIEKGRKASELFSSLIAECINEVESLLPLARKYGYIGRAEEDIEDVRKYIGDRDVCVPRLKKSRNMLKDVLAPTFVNNRARLMSAIENVLGILVDEVAEYNGYVLEVREKIASMNDPGSMNELLELESSFKSNLTAVVEELNGRLSGIEAEIIPNEPEKDFWDRDEGIKDLVDKVDAKKDLDDFMKDALAALEGVVKQYRKDVMFKKVLENYRKLEPIISKKLEEKGRLGESDLNVKYADKFMHFYSSTHPDVEFKRNLAILVSKSIVASKLLDKSRRR